MSVFQCQAQDIKNTKCSVQKTPTDVGIKSKKKNTTNFIKENNYGAVVNLATQFVCALHKARQNGFRVIKNNSLIIFPENVKKTF